MIIAHIVVTPRSEVDLALSLNNSHIEQVKSISRNLNRSEFKF